MKNRKILTAIGAVIVASFLSTNLAGTPAYAQPRDLFNEALVISTFGLMSPRLRNALNLTADQQTKIAASREKFRQAYKAYLDALRPLRKDVADRLFGPNAVKEADVAAEIAHIADLREGILREGFRIALEVRQILRPDQFAKAAAIRLNMIEIQNEVNELYSAK